MRYLLAASALLLAVAPAVAPAQLVPVQTIAGTRLDVAATGEVTRVPDIARISAGVVTQAPTATAAIAQNGQRMASVRAALRRAGIAERDIQTSQISLNFDYRYAENQPPQLVGYRAANQVSIRFRDIAETGRILDALVAQGANQINGPVLEIEKQEEALDEARTAALKTAQKRADLYARAIGKRVKRIVAISESGPLDGPVVLPGIQARAEMAAETKIDPGEQRISLTLNVTYELE